MLDAREAVAAAQVLHIIGPSLSGKTELCLQTAVTAILPATHNGVPLGGWGGALCVLGEPAATESLQR